MMSSGQAVYEATSNIMIPPNQEDCSARTLDAVLVSCSTPTPLLLQESALSAAVTEDRVMFVNVQKREYFALPAASGAETSEETCDDPDVIDDLCAHQVEKKRRLSAQQVKLLERSFETENKLEPERKLQLARDLNLQPRQVAVWFQNRRARWKTKQLEKDYNLLKGNYDSLKADYDSLLRERERLQMEVNSLRSKWQGNADETKLDELLDSTELAAQEKDTSSVNNLQADTVSCLSKVELSSIESLKDSSSGCNHEAATAVTDASSPQPMDSALSSVQYSTITSPSTVDAPEMALSSKDGMKAVFVPHTYQQFLKHHEDSVEEETYNKYFYTIVDDDDQPPFPWWNWP